MTGGVLTASSRFLVGQGPETDSDPNTGKFSSLQSEGNYTFRFNDGCKTVLASVKIPRYSQPTWEVGFGAICPGSTTANIEVINLEPAGLIVGPYRWRIIAENSDIYVTPLPFPNSIGQTSPIFANLPAKNASFSIATYSIQGNDACKNSFLGTGKVGILPDEVLILNQTKICPDGHAIIRARVSIPLAGGGTYIYYRDGIEVARSTNLFTYIMNAFPGSYTARVYPDIIGNPTCFSETSANVVVSGNIGLACVITQPTCTNRSGGSITTTVTNGIAPFTYLWSNGATTASITGLTGGTYTVTVSDAAFCMVSCTSVITPPINCCEINALIAQNLICYDNSTPGIISDNRLRFNLLATNGSNILTTYNVTVNHGTTITPTSGTYGIPIQFTLGVGSGGGGGTFTVTLSDSTTPNCSQTVSIVDPGTCEQAEPPCDTVKCGTATIRVN